MNKQDIYKTPDPTKCEGNQFWSPLNNIIDFHDSNYNDNEIGDVSEVLFQVLKKTFDSVARILHIIQSECAGFDNNKPPGLSPIIHYGLSITMSIVLHLIPNLLILECHSDA